MSWWTKNRKKVGLAAALIAAPYALPALGGMFGLGAAGTAGAAGAAGAAGGTAAGAAGTAAAGTAAAAAPEVAALTASPGMFGMVPGVSVGSEQAAMLAAQNAGLGGTAADLTAQAAKTATGNAGFLDSIVNTAKADLAGMNDPSVWLDRLGRNAGRMAGNMGKSMATGAVAQALMGSPTPPPAPPPPGPQGPSTPPPDVFAASNAGGGFADANLDALAAKLGIPKSELIKMLDQMKGQYA